MTGFNVVKSVASSWIPGAWTAEREWRKGHYQVHYIYTGRSECMFHIFPDGTPRQLRALYTHLAEKQGTKIERFALGSREQFRPVDEAFRRDFRVFNLCANGRFVRPDGTICDLYAERVKAGAKVLNENGMSCGMVVEYGKFRYFTAGDFSDGWKHVDGVWREIEDALAEAVGRVHVAKLNHHGHHSMFPGLVKALKARVWTCCTLDQQHCTDDTMCRLADRSLYDGPRLMLPTYMPLNRPQTPAGRGYLSDVARCVIDQPCHVVLDVPPGGETYAFSCFSAT